MSDDTPAKPDAAAAEPEILAPETAGDAEPDALAQLEAERADLKDRLMRSLAEAENIRRRAEREAARDPRPSLEERYASPGAYAAAVQAAALRLQAERLLLPEDVMAINAAAAADTLARLPR